MGPRRIRLVKHDRVDVNGSIHLGPAGSVAAPVPQVAAISDPSLHSQMQEARLVESTAEYAILEVVCGCGCKSQIQCHYVNA